MILYQVSPNINSLAHSINSRGLDTSLISTKASSQNDLLWLAEERQAEMHWVSDVALAAFAVATSGDCNGACAGLTVFAVGHFVLRRPRRSSTPAPVQPVPQSNPSLRPVHERADQLRDAIAQLPAEQQYVVQLRFIERRSLQETAGEYRFQLRRDQVNSVSSPHCPGCFFECHPKYSAELIASRR